MTKPTKWHVSPAKTQINLGIRPVWSESSLSAWRKLGSLATHWAHSEDSGRMPRLIWVFAGRTVILLVLSAGGSLLSSLFFIKLYPWYPLSLFVNYSTNRRWHCRSGLTKVSFYDATVTYSGFTTVSSAAPVSPLAYYSTATKYPSQSRKSI